MSLDKAIEHGKEKRKQYYGCKAIDPSCRNHGSCDYCRFGRLHKYRKIDISTKQKLDEYADESR